MKQMDRQIGYLTVDGGQWMDEMDEMILVEAASKVDGLVRLFNIVCSCLCFFPFFFFPFLSAVVKSLSRRV